MLALAEIVRAGTIQNQIDSYSLGRRREHKPVHDHS